MTVFTLLAGSLTDAIGLRRTFFLGVAICTVARSVMVVTTNPALALACGVLPLAVGEALGTPVLLAATRRYSTTAQRSISFSIIYMVMNIGYVAAGCIFDYVRQLDFHINIGGFEPTTHQQLFIVSLVFEILLFPAIYFLRRSADGKGDNVVLRRSTANFWGRIGGTVRQSAADTAGLFRSANQSVGFLSRCSSSSCSLVFSKRFSSRWTTSSRSGAIASSDFTRQSENCRRSIRSSSFCSSR